MQLVPSERNQRKCVCFETSERIATILRQLFIILEFGYYISYEYRKLVTTDSKFNCGDQFQVEL